MSLHSWMSSILQKQKKHSQRHANSILCWWGSEYMILSLAWDMCISLKCRGLTLGYYSFANFNREQKVFNTKCLLSPWLLVLLGSNLCVGRICHYRLFQMPFAFLNVTEYSGTGICIFNSHEKDRCAILHILQQQFSLGKRARVRITGSLGRGSRSRCLAYMLFGTAKTRFILHYDLSLWPYNLALIPKIWKLTYFGI